MYNESVSRFWRHALTAMTDYKGIQFSFEGKRRHGRIKLLRRIALTILLLVLTATFFLWWQHRDLQQRTSELLSGSISPQTFRSSLPAFHFLPRARAEAVAISWCLEKPEAGEKFLSEIVNRSSFFDPNPILDRLVDQESPAPFITYARFLDRHEFLSAYHTILLQLASYQTVTEDELRQGLAEAPEKAGSEQIKSRIRALNTELGAKELVVIRDRENRILGTWSTQNSRLKERLPGFSLSPLEPLFKSGYRQIRLTLNLELQKHAEQHFRSHHGSLVLLDLESGAILTAYSKPLSEKSGGNSAFSELYEPGSIIKLLTLLSFNEQKKVPLFPFSCKGHMTLDGRLFYDWMVHGNIESAQEAMALSCNLVFARMGLELGPALIKKGLGAFFFDLKHPLKDGPFTFHSGRTRPVESPYALANLSIGLEEIEMSTVHSAVITGLIAGSGILPHPHLLASSSTLLGLVSSRPVTPPLEVHPRSLQYLPLQQSMVMAVDHPLGTARRARNSTIQFASKTGTAGDRTKGLDTVIIAYFPRQNPKYALAFRLERGGKAEYNGALFLNRYLTNFPF